MEQTTYEKKNGFTGSVVTAECGVKIPSFNEVYNCKSDFFLSYALIENETAIVIPGNVGIGVFFCVLRGDYRDDLKEGSGTFAFPDFLKLK